MGCVPRYALGLTASQAPLGHPSRKNLVQECRSGRLDADRTRQPCRIRADRSICIENETSSNGVQKAVYDVVR
jgi:hypothetical protein